MIALSEEDNSYIPKYNVEGNYPESVKSRYSDISCDEPITFDIKELRVLKANKKKYNDCVNIDYLLNSLDIIGNEDLMIYDGDTYIKIENKNGSYVIIMKTK